MPALPGKPASVWLDTAESFEAGPLEADLRVDVAVVGGGILGITTALLLQRAGMSVAVLEAERVGEGVTGHTTAKVSSLHGLAYTRIASKHGEDAARLYGEANQAGLERLASLIDELGIECDFRRKANFTYTESPQDRSKVEDEAELARRLGLPASLVTETDLPFPVVAAVRFEEQAEFHPQRYMLGLAAALKDEGGLIAQGTRVMSVDDGEPCRLSTDQGPVVSANHVVVATHMPFLDRGLYFARLHPERSYALGVRIRGAVPQGMYLSTESPAHSLRAIPLGGEELLLVGGESHKTGQAEVAERYRRLEDWAHDRFDVVSVEYRWATQDNMPADGLPYVGRLWPLSSRLTTATGFQKWGLANGTAAAIMLADRILGRPNAWADTFDSMRIAPRASAPAVVKENANVALQFFADRVLRRGSGSLAPGEGRVVSAGRRQVAASRDETGRLVTLSARCTHLGCIVDWNDGDQTWDCPCHGSRFDRDGGVVQGPAVRPLERVEPPSGL